MDASYHRGLVVVAAIFIIYLRDDMASGDRLVSVADFGKGCFPLTRAFYIHVDIDIHTVRIIFNDVLFGGGH